MMPSHRPYKTQPPVDAFSLRVLPHRSRYCVWKAQRKNFALAADVWQLRARIIQLRMPSPIRPSWSSSAVLGEGMWDSGGCDASYPLTPVSPFASLREEMSLGSVAVSSRGSGVSPLPLRRSLWSESEGVLLRSSRRQRAAHSHSDRSSSATPLSPRPRSFLLQRMRVPEGKSL